MSPVLVLVLALAAGLTGGGPRAAAQESTTATVANVEAGDSVDVLSGGRSFKVRVLGISSPVRSGGTVQCGSEQSRDFARQTLAGRQISLVTDPTQPAADRYGRVLRYIVLPDGRNYSVVAAEAGQSRSNSDTPPVQLHTEIQAAEQRARAAGRGLWGPPCHGQAPAPAPAPHPPPPPTPGAAGGGTGVALDERGGPANAWLAALDAACRRAGAGPGCVRVTFQPDDPRAARNRDRDCEINFATPPNATLIDGTLYVPSGSTISQECNCKPRVQPTTTSPSPTTNPSTSRSRSTTRTTSSTATSGSTSGGPP